MLVSAGKKADLEGGHALEFERNFHVYARELNLVSKCRKMNKFYCEIIKSRGKYGEKMKYFKLKSLIQ